MQKYTQAQIDEAIEALEIFGNNHENPHVLTVEHEDPIVDDLAFTAFCETDVDGDVASLDMDALEAAARLREGKLPGTPEWDDSEGKLPFTPEWDDSEDGEDLEE